MADTGAFTADFGVHAEDYARHRAGFPVAFFDALKKAGVGLPDQRILDLGTGTGTLARGLSRQGARVTGLDLSEEMLSEAKRLSAAEGLDISFLDGSAENTGLPDQAFDIVVAGQCWHWFDGPTAAREADRVLVEGGMLAICHFDWVPDPDTVVGETVKLIETHNPAWPYGKAVAPYRHFLPVLEEAGYEPGQEILFDVEHPYSHEAWRGRIRASAGIGGTLEPNEVDAFDAELRDLLTRKHPEEPLQILHRCWAVLATPLESQS